MMKSIAHHLSSHNRSPYQQLTSGVNGYCYRKEAITLLNHYDRVSKQHTAVFGSGHAIVFNFNQLTGIMTLNQKI